jgi:hypothetical protein
MTLVREAEEGILVRRLLARVAREGTPVEIRP